MQRYAIGSKPFISNEQEKSHGIGTIALMRKGYVLHVAAGAETKKRKSYYKIILLWKLKMYLF